MNRYDNEYCVYIHRNALNGKVYIGKALGKPEIRWNSGKGYKSNPLFYQDIQKYGWDGFTHEVLAQMLSPKEAEWLEALEIRSHKATDPRYGYNNSPGNVCNARLYEEGKRSERTKADDIERDLAVIKTAMEKCIIKIIELQEKL